MVDAAVLLVLVTLAYFVVRLAKRTSGNAYTISVLDNKVGLLQELLHLQIERNKQLAEVLMALTEEPTPSNPTRVRVIERQQQQVTQHDDETQESADQAPGGILGSPGSTQGQGPKP